jgi:hypothetical protein
MKKALLGILVICGINTLAGEKFVDPTKYTILGDSLESAVPVGFCLVKGHAFKNNIGVPNGKVATLNGKYSTMTDTLGEYKLLIPSTDTSIFFFKKQYNEVVVWNYNFRSQHVVTLNFNTNDEMPMTISFKPVIYLYSEDELTASLELDYHGDLTFSYPELDSQWDVTVNKNGITHEGKPYPYLFWEGVSKDINFDFEEDGSLNGSVLEKNNVVSFLELKLEELGLNQIEKTDFITFWAPKMVTSNFVMVQFIIDEDYETQIAELTIDRIPDNSRRVYMYYSNFDVKPEILTHPQKFQSFNREGFTLLEWGGSVIDLEQEDI